MSELNNQSDLLQQLKKLRSEKELLEKHVFLLNNCLSVEELKAKISDLERKQKTLVEMEDMLDKLRVEIEPLNYLKSILENKLIIENEFNEIENSRLDVCETSARYEYLKTQNIQSIPTNLIKTNSVSSQKLNDKHLDTTQKLSTSNTRSFVNDGCLDKYLQLLDQYHLVTNQEVLNFSENHLKTPSINQESTISVMNDTDNDNKQTVTTSSVDVKDTVQLKYEENNLSIEKNTESSLDNFVNRDITNLENCSGQLCEASTSVPFENNKKSDFYPNFNDFFSNIHASLLKQEMKKQKQIFIAKENEQPDMNNANKLSQPHIGGISNPLNYSDSESGDCLLKIPPSMLKDHFQKQSLKTFITSDIKDSNQKLDDTNKSNNESNSGDYILYLQQLWKDVQLNFDNVGDKSDELLTDDSITASSNIEACTKYNKIPDKAVDLTALNNETININEPTKTESNLQKSSNTSNSEINVNGFNDMNLKIDILRGINSLGFVNPTVLQQRVIVHCLNGRNVIVFSGSNNGRTMMFTIPLLQRIETNLNECQALVLVPTQNVAVHIQKTIMTVGNFLGVNVCIGCDNVPKKLSVVPHVIIGTPTGVSNMIECKSLRIGCIQTVVINKANMMLTQNFVKLIKDILEKLVKNKQVTVLTSDKLDHILDLYMDTLHDPLVIISPIEEENKILPNPVKEENKISPISLPKQFYLNIQEEWKLNALCEIIETLKLQRAIIFCNTFDKAHTLYQLLHKMNYAVSVFNMEMNVYERKKKLAKFSSNCLKMIITTDPVEGYHFHHAAWIINYDLPLNPIHYINRIVKCAKKIKVLNLINENDDHIKSTIEKHIKSHMIQMPLNMMDLLQY